MHTGKLPQLRLLGLHAAEQVEQVESALLDPGYLEARGGLAKRLKIKGNQVWINLGSLDFLRKAGFTLENIRRVGVQPENLSEDFQALCSMGVVVRS